MHVKKEIVETSLLSLISSPAILSGDSENFSVSGSISSVAGSQAQSIHAAPNKKVTVMKPVVTTARALRRKPKADAMTGNSSEVESVSVRNLRMGNNSLTQQSGPASVESNAVKILPSSSKRYNHQLPGISPPRRSSRLSEIHEPAFMSDRDRTPLSTDQDGAYMPTALDEISSRVQNDKVSTSPSLVPRRRSKSQKYALYNQGPVFRTQFYNTFGPSDYSSYQQDNSASGIPYGQYVDRGSSSMGNPTFNNFYYQGSSNPTFSVPYDDHMYRHYHSENRYITRPLAPAFDWENHVPSESNCSSAKHDYSVPAQEAYGQQVSVMNLELMDLNHSTRQVATL